MPRFTPFNLRQFTGIDDYFLVDGFYPFDNNSVNESYGVPDFLMSVVTKIINKIISLKNLSKNSFRKTLYINVSSICKYFDNIIIDLRYNKNMCNDSGSAKYIPESFIKTNDIKIEIEISGKYLDPLRISSYLYHEILHAYEDKILFMKYNISLVDKMRNDNYGLWLYILDNKDVISYETLIFAYLMYHLNKDELNANIAQIEPDCLDFINNISFSHDVNKLFKQTASYKRIKAIEQKIYEIDTMSDEDEDRIILDINKLVNEDGLTFTKRDFKIFRKQLMVNWSKYQRKFRINASKIIYKLYQMTQHDNQFINISDII